MRFKIEKIFMKDLTTLFLTLVLFPVFSGAQEPLVVKNLTVIKEKNRVAGWPANHGIWSWGNEIVVGFSFGFHDDEKDEGHPIKGPTSNLQARSLNGGETWAVEELSFLDADENEKGPADCSAVLTSHNLILHSSSSLAVPSFITVQTVARPGLDLSHFPLSDGNKFWHEQTTW